MIIRLKKGDSYIDVDTELNKDEVDTIMKCDEVNDDEMGENLGDE